MSLKQISANEFELSSAARIISFGMPALIVIISVAFFLSPVAQAYPIEKLALIVIAVLFVITTVTLLFLRITTPVRIKIRGNQLAVIRQKERIFDLDDIKSVSIIRINLGLPTMGLELQNGKKILFAMILRWSSFQYATESEIELFAKRIGKPIGEKKRIFAQGPIFNLSDYELLQKVFDDTAKMIVLGNNNQFTKQF